MWSDSETERDCLGYSSFVSVLTDVCLHKDLAPLTLGVFGSWGSGKTSLMRILKRSIEDITRPETGPPRTQTLWFNAWKYEGREEAQSALVHAVLAKLESELTLGEEAKRLVKQLKESASVLKLGKALMKSALTLTPQINDFVGAFQEESDKVAKTMQSFEKNFEDLLERAAVDRVVVFIDDLDRCSSAKVIETFETIKLFLNTPACTFVIGADAAKIQDAVGEVYKVADAQRKKDYLEKIVQIPFTIPEQGLKDIACYVGMLILGRRLQDEGWKEFIAARPKFYGATGALDEAFATWARERRVLFDFGEGGIDPVLEELKAVLPYVDIIARGLRGNPRQIKRFLNVLALRRALAMANDLHVEPDLLIKLVVLEYVWEEFFGAVVDTVDPETGCCPLIEEMLKAVEDPTRAEGSKLVAESLGHPGLVSFLTEKPALSGDIDLSPYLFLAQTALHRGRTAALQPVEQAATSLVAAIASDDTLRSKVAAKQAAAKEPGVLAAVVRSLAAGLATAKEHVVQTHIINGFDAICHAHKEHYEPCVAALVKLEASGNDAVAIAATAFLSRAARAGVAIPEGLADRFKKGSKLAEALAPGKDRGAGKRQ